MTACRTDRAEPCASCPYRRSSKLALWRFSEFENLLRTEADVIGSIFNCHSDGELPRDEQGVCVGWLLDQKRRGLPSIMLRIALGRPDGYFHRALRRARTPRGGLYASVLEMVTANARADRRLWRLRAVIKSLGASTLANLASELRQLQRHQPLGRNGKNRLRAGKDDRDEIGVGEHVAGARRE